MTGQPPDSATARAMGSMLATFVRDGERGVSRLLAGTSGERETGDFLRAIRQDFASLRAEAQREGWDLWQAWRHLRDRGFTDPDAAVIAAALETPNN